MSCAPDHPIQSHADPVDRSNRSAMSTQPAMSTQSTMPAQSAMPYASRIDQIIDTNWLPLLHRHILECHEIRRLALNPETRPTVIERFARLIHMIPPDHIAQNAVQSAPMCIEPIDLNNPIDLIDPDDPDDPNDPNDPDQYDRESQISEDECELDKVRQMLDHGYESITRSSALAQAYQVERRYSFSLQPDAV